MFWTQSFAAAGIAYDLETFRKAQATQDDLHHSDRWEAAIAASECVTEEMVEKLALAGTPQELIPKIEALEAAGVDFVTITPFYSTAHPMKREFDQAYVIRSFGERVIPRFR